MKRRTRKKITRNKEEDGEVEEKEEEECSLVKEKIGVGRKEEGKISKNSF